MIRGVITTQVLTILTYPDMSNCFLMTQNDSPGALQHQKLADASWIALNGICLAHYRLRELKQVSL